MTASKKLSVAVLISGGGTTLKNLLEKIRERNMPVDVAAVISSNPASKGLVFAAQSCIPAYVFETKNYDDKEKYSRAIFDCCRDREIELVVMGGFLKQLVIPDDYANKVVNIHPALIPSFCGKGFYGHHVHEAVLEYGAKISGCTVHFADNEYDHGPVILQRAAPVLNDDTPDTLAARVFEAECEAYPEAIRLIAEGKVQMDGRRVRILD